MIFKIEPIDAVIGEIEFEGDKSISHRALIMGGLAKGETKIKNLSSGLDVNSTKSLLMKLGVGIYSSGSEVIVEGVGFKGFSCLSEDLDCGNSGTTARLMSGLLAAQEFNSTLIGDDSLSTRPMRRVAEPLREMGGEFSLRGDNYLPMNICGGRELNAINYTMPVPSAQVKSALLLAGLHINDTTKIYDHWQTRDHTENMLGLKIERNEGGLNSTTDSKSGSIISVDSRNYPKPFEYSIPGDVSTAAFFIVLGLILKNSRIIIRNLLLNKSRIAFIELLVRMGGEIKILSLNDKDLEVFGDLEVKSSELCNCFIDREIIPKIIDEIPILTIAGVFAEGEFRINGAEELRKKECDRIMALCSNLKQLTSEVEEFNDGFTFSIDKESLNRIRKREYLFNSFNDHRIAMAFSILSLVFDNGSKIDNFECVNISNPNFIKQIRKIAR